MNVPHRGISLIGFYRRGEMSQSSPLLITARTVEDIIQITKINGKLPKYIESEILKEKIEDVDNKFNKHIPGIALTKNNICLPKVIEGNVIKHTDFHLRKRTEGSEGDHNNLAVKQVEDVKVTDKIDSELELKSWPSDSDITVLRVKKEYRSELSTRLKWEQGRTLTGSSSLINFNWESHSLINLTNAILNEKYYVERLVPYTIWAKSDTELELSKQNTGQCLADPKSETDPTRSSLNISQKSEDAIFCPSDEMTFYEPVTQQEETNVMFCEASRRNSPVFNENVSFFCQKESSSKNNINSCEEKKETSNISSSGIKCGKSGKMKLFRKFYNFFGQCGSRKTSTD